LFQAGRSRIDRRDAGFTLIEVLVALAIVAVAVLAIGSVMSTNSRSVKGLEDHVALVQTAQAVLATAIPPRDDLAPGTLTGVIRDYQWQVDIGPVSGGWVVENAKTSWIPELIKIRVRARSGAAFDFETVRLMKKRQP
jgi:general secretion pathway protein I